MYVIDGRTVSDATYLASERGWQINEPAKSEVAIEERRKSMGDRLPVAPTSE